MGLPKIKNETRLVIFLVQSMIFFVYLLFQQNNIFNNIILTFGFISYGFFSALVCYLVLKQKNLITAEGINKMEGN